MGDLYRADDLRLGQPVALKFLPRRFEGDPAWRARLLDEVRIARRVAHPNVCRVHDAAEHDGLPFISLEFIDGEDLASLLRRIGRVPPEKAVVIARQLCAGLAAAHDQGVLHRDLKPANVMIDGRGRARITDFGLAALQARTDGRELRSGTPAYMAPEQREGGEVSPRSDLYSLGLVLHEVFTGRPALGKNGEAGSSFEGIDPDVEMAIQQCLDPDPARRPSSARAVAAALPRADGVAMALAAGETPSPEVVAASPDEGSMRPGLAWLALGGCALFLAAAVWIATELTRSQLGFERSPEGLAERARDLLTRTGHAGKWEGRAWGYLRDADPQRRLDSEESPEAVRAALAGRAPVVRFWYRESPRALLPEGGDRVTARDPPVVGPGASLVEMSTDGRLLSLRVVPPLGVDPRPSEPDWGPLFAAAGLDPRRFETAAPRWTPPDFADVRRAWTGPAPEASNLTVRVEAAAFQGAPVFFRLGLDRELASGADAGDQARNRLFLVLLAVLLWSMLAAALWLAWRNLAAGRGDRRGARRVAAILFLVEAAALLFGASHAPVVQEFDFLLRMAAAVLLKVGIAWLFYIALEPLLRRASPRTLVGWTRLLAGRIKDPLVGRDFLLGGLLGAAYALNVALASAWEWREGRRLVAGPEFAGNLIGAPALLRGGSAALVSALTQALAFTILWQLFARALRSPVRGAVALACVLAFGLSVGHRVALPFILLGAALLALSISRLGLLATATMLLVFHLTLFIPMTTDLAAWFAQSSAFAFALCLLPAAYGAWVVGRRPHLAAGG